MRDIATGCVSWDWINALFCLEFCVVAQTGRIKELPVRHGPTKDGDSRSVSIVEILED